jgi:hypothetical protein
MPTIAISGRRCGKTAAAAHAAGMSIDAYRELMRQQHERLDAARFLTHQATPDRLSSAWWDQVAAAGPLRPRSGAETFLREYTLTFEDPVSVPIVFTVTIPGRDDWLRRWMTEPRDAGRP